MGGKRLANGWQKAGKRLAKGWQRAGKGHILLLDPATKEKLEAIGHSALPQRPRENIELNPSQ